MKNFRLTQFADPEFLGAIRPDLLKQLLSDYHAYFATRGIDLAEEDIDYGTLCRVIADGVDAQRPGGGLVLS